jgi:hypothetical protein
MPVMEVIDHGIRCPLSGSSYRFTVCWAPSAPVEAVNVRLKNPPEDRP